MRKLLFLYAVCLLLVFPMVANATSISVDQEYWSNSRSTNNGIEARDGWSGLDLDNNKEPDNNGFKISWEISLDGTRYNYKYTISGVDNNYLSFGLSHLNVEVTNTSSENDFVMKQAEAVNRETKVNKDDTYKDLSESLSSKILFEGPAPFEPSDSSGSNPNMPDDIYAIKWDMDGKDGIFGNKSRDIVEFYISFTSENYPVWGDFYANDGIVAAEAWNLGFGTDPTTTDFTNWIARPNGSPTHAPEPATMLLLGSGLIGIAVSGKKRLKKRNG